jgi:hypothetical protein
MKVSMTKSSGEEKEKQIKPSASSALISLRKDPLFKT